MDNEHTLLLVTTPIESTWGINEPIVFAGEWCQLYERKLTWSSRLHEVSPYHWDDRVKFKYEYDYLELLHKKLLTYLSLELNKLHAVAYTCRAWQVLLDPWLVSYVSVLFDRWEVLRQVFEGHSNLSTILPKGRPQPCTPLDYAEYIGQILTDEWNYLLFSRIIRLHYIEQCEVIEQDFIIDSQRSDLPVKTSCIKKIVARVDALLGRMFSEYRVVLFGGGFSFPARIRLNFKLRQVPRLYFSEFTVMTKEEIKGAGAWQSLDRHKLISGWAADSEFEVFLKKSLVVDMPFCLIEAFQALKEKADNVAIKTKIMATASEHWANTAVKFWLSTQIERGAKLVVLGHGGSIPAYKDLFNFEEEISDVKGTWFVPCHDKHVQVPPAKMIGRFQGMRKKGANHLRQYCSCIGSEQPRWTCRAQFSPMGAQCLLSYQWVITLHASLRSEIQERFKVKPYPNRGWNTFDRYTDELGVDKIFCRERIDEVFSQSKIIICTYPETTFSEAMALGFPVILVYPPQFYERVEIASSLLSLLIEANIIFHDPVAAAEHVNAIWDNADHWWESTRVVSARSAFQQQALLSEEGWLEKWSQFLTKGSHF
jgi:putative transferase (TIGR04331 family)